MSVATYAIAMIALSLVWLISWAGMFRENRRARRELALALLDNEDLRRDLAEALEERDMALGVIEDELWRKKYGYSGDAVDGRAGDGAGSESGA